ncbi:MAG: GldG family protein [Candidatus Eisenbacteria bacterium]|nr:GldG family protein [Candidatus Eisenbacteria bacterium]
MIGPAERAKLRAAAGVVGVAAALAAVSLVSLGRFARVDLTEKKEFTVSRSTRELLASVGDVITVTVYLSDDLPRHLTGFRTRIEDVLDEFRAYGGERVRVSVVDPARDAETEARAQQSGVMPVQFQAIEKDRAEVRAAYAGMTVRFEDRLEAIPFIGDPGRLEYDLVSAILKVTMERRPVVGVLVGHGERSIGTEYSAAAAALGETYEVREVSAGDLAVGTDVITLVVAGPGHAPDAELFEIDQFLMRGGRALFLLDGARVLATGELRAETGPGNVFDFVGRYGALVQPDLVVDTSNAPAAFVSGQMRMMVPYPYWPMAVRPGIAREHPVVAGFDALPFPWTSSISVAEPPPGDAEITVLARSSERSWTVPAFCDLRPPPELSPPPEAAEAIAAGAGGRLPLAVAISGRLTSAFAGGPVIRERDGRVEFTDPEGRISTGAPTRLVVVGNARMFDNALLGEFESSLPFLLNIVDWLTLGDTLAEIRARQVTDRPLKGVGDGERALAVALGSYAGPAGVVLAGLARAARRRRRARAPGARRPEARQP